MNTFMSHYVQKLLFLITNLASSALNIVIYIMVPKLCLRKHTLSVSEISFYQKSFEK